MTEKEQINPTASYPTSRMMEPDSLITEGLLAHWALKEAMHLIGWVHDNSAILTLVPGTNLRLQMATIMVVAANPSMIPSGHPTQLRSLIKCAETLDERAQLAQSRGGVDEDGDEVIPFLYDAADAAMRVRALAVESLEARGEPIYDKTPEGAERTH